MLVPQPNELHKSRLPSRQGRRKRIWIKGRYITSSNEHLWDRGIESFPSLDGGIDGGISANYIDSRVPSECIGRYAERIILLWRESKSGD